MKTTLPLLNPAMAGMRRKVPRTIPMMPDAIRKPEDFAFGGPACGQ
jgi:hypothetical protein